MVSKYLNPRNDIAFKRLFGSEKNKDILIALLNEVLKNQFHKSIIDVTFLSPFLEPEALANKQSVVDVLCKDEDNCKYIIEMQVASFKGFEERAQYYASKAFVSQIKQGGKYEDLKEVIFLAFTNFSIFPKKRHYKSEHITLDKKTQENDLNKISFTFIDLVKFEKEIKNKKLDDLNLEEKFYYFLRHADDITPVDLENLIGKDKIINKAFKELEFFYWTEQEIYKYEAEDKRVRDNIAAMDYVLDKGMEKGIKKGMEKGMKKGMNEGIKIGIKKGEEIGIKKEKILVAKKLLDLGLESSTIIRVTGLKTFELEEIKSHLEY